MLFSVRRSGAPSLRASLDVRALLHPSFRLEVVRGENVAHDERLAPQEQGEGAPGRTRVTVGLQGAGRFVHRGGEYPLGPGCVFSAPAGGALVCGPGERSFVTLSLVCPGEWTASPEKGATAGRLHPADLMRLRVAATTLGGGDTRPAEQLAAVLEILGSSGVAVRPADASMLREEAPPPHAAVNDAVDRSLSSLRSRPMLIDVQEALGTSPRHAQRLVRAYNRRYGFGDWGWRETVNRWRQRVGVALLAAPGATTEAVASALGYGCSSAFCRAVAEWRLPPPTVMQAMFWGRAA